MKYLLLVVCVCLLGLALARGVTRSAVAGIIFEGPPLATDGRSANAQLVALNNYVATAGSECGTFESVFWAADLLEPGAASIKQSIIQQLTRRGWTYKVLHQQPNVQLFITGVDGYIIVGSWIQSPKVLELAWCLTR